MLGGPDKKSKFSQGYYTPINPKKFIGGKAVYRSSLELAFFKFCDINPNVVKWGSENVIVPYFSTLDNKMHRYFVDNYVEIMEGDKLTKYLVEIKPYKQTIPPVTARKRKKTIIYESLEYEKNRCKWQAAEEFCKQKGFKFLILTEKEILKRNTK